MKKMLSYFIMILFFCFGMALFSGSVKAAKPNIYNGYDLEHVPSDGNGCDYAYLWGPFCRDYSRRGTRISIVYYNGLSYDVLGILDFYPNKDIVRYGQRFFGSTKVSGGVSMGSADEVGKGNYMPLIQEGMPTSGSGEATYWENILIKEVVDASGNIIEDSDGNYIIEKIMETGGRTGCSLTNDECWERPSEAADPNNGLKKIGYRILIEPITLYFTPNGPQYLMTPTEFAYVAKVAHSALSWPKITTDAQLSAYVRKNERMITEFDDIGIRKPVNACTDSGYGHVCTASEVQNQGHALHIIDLTNVLKTKCDYETGKGFPKGKKPGDKLTKQEQECCDEQVKKIQEKYKIAQSTPTQCMLVSDSIPSFVNCMNIYFQGTATAQKKWRGEKNELLKFNDRFPACSTDRCEYAELVTIENTYTSCISSMTTLEWINSILVCEETDCETKYKKELSNYKQTHKLCDISEWEKKAYTNNCEKKVLTTDCKEDNPNHFPKSGDKNPDKSCCIYFEEKMKKEYEAKGYSQAEINKKINDWFNAKDFRQNCLISKCDINASTLTPECCDELKAKYPNKSESFWKGKGCGISDNKCTWHDYANELTEHLKDMMGANCAIGSSTSITASDTKNWECIYDSVNIKSGSKEDVFKEYYLKYSNPYCAVYCREDVRYDFPKGTMIVKAGSHFTVGDTGIDPQWKSVQFTSTRECKTKGPVNNNSKEILTDKFKSDWKKANENVARTWDYWKKAEIFNILWGTAKPKSSSYDCDKRCHGGLTYVYEEKRCRNEDGEWDICIEGNWKCLTYYENFDFYYYPRIRSRHYSGPYVNETIRVAERKCGGPDSKDEPSKAYYDAVEALENIEDDILACTSWDNFDQYRNKEKVGFSNDVDFVKSKVEERRYAKYSYYKDFAEYKEFNPDLTIVYKEPTFGAYDYTGLLKKTITWDVDDNFSTTGASFNKQRYVCDYYAGKFPLACRKEETFEYSPEKYIEAIYTKEINYTLKDGVFNTILKPQGTAVNGSVAGSSSSQIYIKLGYSALHVHFMTPTGVYDIGLTYPGFTPGGKNEHNFDKVKQEIMNTNDKYKYDCTYVVHNEIIENEDPKCVGDNCIPICTGDRCTACSGDNCSESTLKGLNLIYRPISLGNPFPGINGLGRTPGSNWNDSNLIKNYITNNRGVKGSAIYTKAPMYQITLTPALIQKIRKYNATTNYNDFNMDCTSNGTECKSNFLRGNVGNSTYDFSKEFKTCTIAGNRGSVTCCGIGNWNDCDSKDNIRRFIDSK